MAEQERDVSTFYRWAARNRFDYAKLATMVKGPGWAIVNMDRCRDMVDDKQSLHPELGDCVGAQLGPVLTTCLGTPDPQTDITMLQTEEDVPKCEEWPVLAERFPSVRWLSVEAGFNENWEDGPFPQDWPLDALVVSGPCGEAFQTPVILDGRVPHLVLFLTNGFRFEGPPTDELMRLPTDLEPVFIEVDGHSSPEKAASTANVNGTPGKRRVEVRSVPDRVVEWIMKTHPDGSTFPDYAPHEGKPPSRMRTLEVLENDAADTFFGMAFACARVVNHLHRLNLRTTSGLDFHRFDEDLLPQILEALPNLKELQLSVSDVTFNDKALLWNLHKHFPPNLEVLEFRGPPSLAQSEEFADWIASFGKADGFLPKLRKLSFVLDATFRNGEIRGQEPPSKEDMAAADAPTHSLLEAAQKRGITVEKFHDPWMETGHFV